MVESGMPEGCPGLGLFCCLFGLDADLSNWLELTVPMKEFSR